MIWKIILAFFCIAVGIFMAVKPDIYWEINESWKSKDADGPSDEYCQRVRGAGILLAVIMTGLLILVCLGVF